MFKIIGADGREYGPATAEQLREWIRQGRANANTRVLPAGATDWKKLSELEEFAAELSMNQPPSELPGATPSGDAEALARDILSTGYDLEIGRCFSRGWQLVMENFWLTVGASLVLFLLTWLAGTLVVASLLLNYVLWAGLDWMFLKLIRGRPAEFSDAFAGFTLMFVPLMLFSLVAQSLVTVGLFLCILPGIYAMTIWLMFGGLVIIDKRLDFWPAMELCRKVVNLHFWKVLGLMLAGLLALILGLAVCLVGFFIALPVVVAATVYAYEDIFGSRGVTFPGQQEPLVTAPVSPPTQPAP
jgi:ABC-type amino acid transport system permease subunit